MRHKRRGRKLGVTTKHRRAMLRNMVTDLFRHERIKTTDTRAKELKRVAEKMITLAKQGTLHKRRQAAAYIRDNEVLKKLFDDIADRFKERPGGYTRIIKLGFRKGDNTPVSIVELVEEGYKPKAKKKSTKATKKKSPKASAKAKTDETKAKSSKKESAEELGLIESEESKAQESVEATEATEIKTAEEAPKAETEVQAEPLQEVGEEAEAEQIEAKEEAPSEEVPAEAQTEPEETPEEPEAKAEPDAEPEETPDEDTKDKE